MIEIIARTEIQISMWAAQKCTYMSCHANCLSKYILFAKMTFCTQKIRFMFNLLETWNMSHGLLIVWKEKMTRHRESKRVANIEK